MAIIIRFMIFMSFIAMVQFSSALNLKNIKRCLFVKPPVKRPINNCVSGSYNQNGEIRGRTALDNFPLIDGHNDLAWTLNIYKNNQLADFDFNLDPVLDPDFSNCTSCQHTSLPKLRAGKVGAQFFSAYVNCESQYKDAVALTLEQIDVIKRLIAQYPRDIDFATTANGILEAIANNKIGGLIGIEGGHLIGNRLSVLRAYYELGARYLTLTHSCNTPWADASPMDKNSTNTLTKFGRKIVLEMNRLGMLVDISHVSYHLMVEALRLSKAPVMFSHSSSHAVFAHHRNVRDDILRKLKKNGGVIMVNFFTEFVGPDNADIKTVANHINHIVDVCGVGCVGIGADYNGVETMPEGLDDVSKYPELFDFLRQMNPRRWTIANLERLAGRNFIRAFRKVERVRDSLKHLNPVEDWIPEKDLVAVDDEAINECTTPRELLNSRRVVVVDNENL